MKAAAISTAIIATALSLPGWRAAAPLDAQVPAQVLMPAVTAGSAPASIPTREAAEAEDPYNIRIPGQVQPRTKVALSARVSLPVVELPFREGQRVTKGDPQGSVAPSVLVRLDEADLRAALRTAEAKRDAEAAEIAVAQLRLAVQESQIATSKICLGEAERQWGRLQQLIASGDTSAAAADEARSKYERAKSDSQAVLREQEASQGHLTAMRDNLKAAEAEVERAKLALAAATIVSPIDGVITRVNVAVGEVAVSAASNPSAALIEVADMDHLVLVARADEQAIGKMAVGQKATVRLKGYGNESFTGTVQHIALAGTEGKDGKSQFRTEISLDTGGRVIPAGVSGEAKIECPARNDQG